MRGMNRFRSDHVGQDGAGAWRYACRCALSTEALSNFCPSRAIRNLHGTTKVTHSSSTAPGSLTPRRRRAGDNESSRKADHRGSSHATMLELQGAFQLGDHSTQQALAKPGVSIISGGGDMPTPSSLTVRTKVSWLFRKCTAARPSVVGKGILEGVCEKFVEDETDRNSPLLRKDMRLHMHLQRIGRSPIRAERRSSHKALRNSPMFTTG